MKLQRRLHHLIDDALGQDPRAALIAVRELSAEQLPWVEQRVVALARREHWAWARIARLLGCSRQHVHRRFRRLAPTLPHDPLADHHQWQRTVARLQADIARGGGGTGHVDRDGEDDEAVPS